MPNKLEEINFSGSKKPDGYHYEMIRCKQCSLLYASEIYDEEFSNNLYEESDFYNTNEIQGLKKTYGNCISQALKNMYLENTTLNKNNIDVIHDGADEVTDLKIKISLNKNIKTKDDVAISTLCLIIAAIKDRDIESRTQKKGD